MRSHALVEVHVGDVGEPELVAPGRLGVRVEQRAHFGEDLLRSVGSIRATKLIDVTRSSTPSRESGWTCVKRASSTGANRPGAPSNARRQSPLRYLGASPSRRFTIAESRATQAVASSRWFHRSASLAPGRSTRWISASARGPSNQWARGSRDRVHRARPEREHLGERGPARRRCAGDEAQHRSRGSTARTRAPRAAARA